MKKILAMLKAGSLGVGLCVGIGTSLGIAIGAATLQPAHADVVVELYTSQGCSSCPPADALLGELAGREDVIALSLHVDYWDYLGWKDDFADPAFSARQRGYAATAGQSMIYTPQMIIGGKDHIVGTKAMDLADMLMRHKEQEAAIGLVAERQGDTVSIRAEAAQASAGGLIVQLVQYSAMETVSIKRGENAGRDMTYHNVVKGWSEVAQWDGTSALSVDAPASGDNPMVVIIQRAGPGPILAAAKVK